MEAQLNELRVENESLKRRLAAMEKALLNITGFYIDTADGSEQGLIKYGKAPTQVEPQPILQEVAA